MAIALRAARRALAPAQADAELARLEQGPGCYFGVDAGIPGLHPLQATLLSAPALALRVFGDGLQVHVLSPFGERLLRLPELARWQAGAVRRAGGDTVAALRAFLACFAPSPEVLLLGALPFAAHRLAVPGSDAGALGVLFFGERLLRRDANGAWKEVRLELADGEGKDRDKQTAASAFAAVADGQPARGHAAAAAVSAGSGSVPEPTQGAADAPIDAPADDHPPGGYAQMVARALPVLRERPLVSLTLSQSYRRRVTLSAAQAFARLRAANPAPASFFLNDGLGTRLLGASPDLQLVVAQGEVQALPVCGTVGRRPGAVGEAESLRELMNEEVDAAALAVCSDALRADLAPLCVPGTLRLVDRRRPMSLATVVHAVDRLQGKLRRGADAWDAIVATAAPVMVTGTPRAEALRAIGTLEASPRGWYGGLVVQVAANGDALAGTILRAARVAGGVAEVRTGGDLLADSSPEREEEESRLKTLSLWRAFGLAPPAAGAAGSPDTGALSGTGAARAGAAPLSLRLCCESDPLAAALRDCLQGLGCVLSERAATRVLAGDATALTDAALADAVLAEAQGQGLVAIGDAAARVLAAAGWPVRRALPQQGRLLRCTPTSGAPWAGASPFGAARYATLEVEAIPLPAGWQVWLTGEQHEPLALAHAGSRRVCLLFRPDSLLSEPQALQVLRAALDFAAGRGVAPVSVHPQAE